ncbi:GNAT family N-acetyltransferase [Nocardiopsis nanhaiensis]
MSDVHVRPATPQDLNAVAALRWWWMRENHGEPDVPLDDFVPRFVDWGKRNADSHHCFIAVLRGTVIGMAWLAVTRRVPFPGEFERASGDVQCVYVLPEHRDGGVGGLMVEAVLELARESGVGRVTVHSSDRAVSAYARHGFAVSRACCRPSRVRPPCLSVGAEAGLRKNDSSTCCPHVLQQHRADIDMLRGARVSSGQLH